MRMPKLFLLLLCSIQLPGKYLLIKLSEKGKTYNPIYSFSFSKGVYCFFSNAY